MLVVLSSTSGWFGSAFGFVIIFVAFVMCMMDNGRRK